MSLFDFNPQRGPTVKGKKKLLSLDDKEKKIILNQIKSDWEQLLTFHFEAEGGISDSRITKWRPLTEKHLNFKEDNGYIEDILQMSTPTLLQRYKRGIKINSKNFKIEIQFPTLKHGARGNNPVSASVHQKSYNGRPVRRIIKKDFTASARKRLIEYLTK